MKTTSILTFAAVSSVAAFLLSLIVTQDVLTSSALFAAAAAILIALHDYSPRNYFSITVRPVQPTRRFQPAPAFSKLNGAIRRKSVKRLLSASV